MEEIKVGEFIRTKEPYGDIYKVIGREQENILLVDSLGNNRVETGYVSKHSQNIIDLIEVGDYVNGYRVDYVAPIEDGEGNKYLCVFVEDAQNSIEVHDVKTVVTREQFNSIKYIVGE